MTGNLEKTTLEMPPETRDRVAPTVTALIAALADLMVERRLGRDEMVIALALVLSSGLLAYEECDGVEAPRALVAAILDDYGLYEWRLPA